jgi:hypothetical protein
MSHKHFVFSFSNRDLACTAFLNGIPFFTDNVRNQMDPVLRLNQYIVPGHNKLELVLTVPPTEMILPDEPITFTGKVECWEGDAQNHTQTELINIDWTYDNTQDFPIRLGYSFDVGLGYGSRVWQAGEQVTESNLNLSELLNYIGQLKAALESKVFSVLEPFLAFRHLELSKAFGFSVDEMRSDDKRFFEELYADPDWRMSDFDSGNLIIDYWAGNRILSLQRHDGLELLRTPKLCTIDIFYSLPLKVSRIDNNWHIVL